METDKDYPPIANDEDYINETEQLKEVLALLAMQEKRYGKARVVWQMATGRDNVWPDLGNLLDWLLEKTDRSSIAREIHKTRGHKGVILDPGDPCLIDLYNVLTKEDE